ncbi:MAG: hypothetical protein H0U62_07935 [Actinobacteria bacterium]|nr:hypothetical protein [Actinomycetota bacterium]
MSIDFLIFGTAAMTIAGTGAGTTVAIVVAAAGGMGPVGAALVHNLGSVAVVMNAARLVGGRIDLPG